MEVVANNINANSHVVYQTLKSNLMANRVYFPCKIKYEETCEGIIYRKTMSSALEFTTEEVFGCRYKPAYKS